MRRGFIKQILTGIFAAVFLVIGIAAVNVQALQQPLVVEKCAVAGDTALAGEDCTLKVTFANSSSTKIRNVKIYFDEATDKETGNIFLLSSGVQSVYVGDIEAASKLTCEIEGRIARGIAAGSYQIPVTVEYVMSDASSKLSELLTVTVGAATKASVTDVKAAKGTIMQTTSGDVTFTVNNMGADTLYNVTAEATGDYISAQTVYLGDVKKGETAAGTIAVTGETISMQAEPVNLAVTYEDAGGNEFTLEKSVMIKVTEYTSGTYNENLYSSLKDAESNRISMSAVMRIVLVIVIVLAGIVALVWYLTKRSLTNKREG